MKTKSIILKVTAGPRPGAATANHLHHEATAKIEEAVLPDHAAAGE